MLKCFSIVHFWHLLDLLDVHKSSKYVVIEKHFYMYHLFKLNTCIFDLFRFKYFFTLHTFVTRKRGMDIKILSQNSWYFFWELYYVKGRTWHEIDVDWARLWQYTSTAFAETVFRIGYALDVIVTLAMRPVISEMSHSMHRRKSVKTRLKTMYHRSIYIVKERKWKVLFVIVEKLLRNFWKTCNKNVCLQSVS